MNNDGLSPEQLKALDPGIQLIEAGPGSGKTRTVVARYRQSIVKGRSAALLSFTNAAVDVARARCRDEPSLLEAPNFIGTFDQFFHRYVLTPYIRRRFGVFPNYLSSWDDLPHHIALTHQSRIRDSARITRPDCTQPLAELTTSFDDRFRAATTFTSVRGHRRPPARPMAPQPKPFACPAKDTRWTQLHDD